jgi:aminoglycoside phosphotransferase family enzyme/predicted kinase
MTASGAAERSATGAMPALVAAMMRPEFYPEPPAVVEFRQTHISWVFLAGRTVYKVKKPVHFSFLDASRLERRRFFCREEVRLNSVLAPDVYQGVVPIISGAGGLRLGPIDSGAAHGVVDYAVRMRRIADECMLDRMVAAGRADEKLIVRIAGRIAAFHRGCARERAWRYGSAAAIWRAILENLAESERLVDRIAAPGDFGAIDGFFRHFMRSNWERLNQRARAGRVIEGHGDLRCEHVAVEDGRISIIDCVEFSEPLRYADMASEIAFLAMDLDRLGAPELSDALVTAYGCESHDDELAQFTNFYKCHRAAIRAKVASLKSVAPGLDSAGTERARDAARAAFALAARYARAGRPAMLVVCGGSGTGKSALARTLALRTGFAVLNSDWVRKRLAGIAPDDHIPTAYNEGIYAPEFSLRTRDAMVAQARDALGAGRGIILDATFREPSWRRAAMVAAASSGVPALFVECRADEAEIVRRLKSREQARGEVSDATVEVYREQKREFVPLTEIPEQNRIALDTTLPSRQTVAMVLEGAARLFHDRSNA